MTPTDARCGHRIRTTAELRRDLVAGCQRLGTMADQWIASGILPADLPAVDRTIAGLHCVLVALRAGGGHGV